MSKAMLDLKEKGIRPRKVIFEVITAILSDSKWPLSEENKLSKIITWHEELKNISDERIKRGLENHRKSPDDSIPSCGVFKQGCLKKIEFYKPNMEKPQFENSIKNIQKIKANLLKGDE